MSSLENLEPLSPIDFFAVQIDCLYAQNKELSQKRHALVDLTPFHGESAFARVWMGWHEEGICIRVDIPLSHPFNYSLFPDFQKGDSIEFFFDTRDVKATGYATRFCHHFFFLPEPVRREERLIQAGEVTRFRSEDAHPLCDPDKLLIQTIKKKHEQQVIIFVPSDFLHGYDPIQFNRLGFTYRINRWKGSSQMFSASDQDFPIEQHPSLWASCFLIRD